MKWWLRSLISPGSALSAGTNGFLFPIKRGLCLGDATERGIDGTPTDDLV